MKQNNTPNAIQRNNSRENHNTPPNAIQRNNSGEEAVPNPPNRNRIRDVAIDREILSNNPLPLIPTLDGNDPTRRLQPNPSKRNSSH